MNKLPNCPQCDCQYTYELDNLIVCPMCNYEFNLDDYINSNTIKDSNNNILNNGDSVTIIKDLKVKGTNSTIKIGTKVKNIRLDFESSDGHNINCKIDGLGDMRLKSEVVKKI